MTLPQMPRISMLLFAAAASQPGTLQGCQPGHLKTGESHSLFALTGQRFLEHAVHRLQERALPGKLLLRLLALRDVAGDFNHACDVSALVLAGIGLDVPD